MFRSKKKKSANGSRKRKEFDEDEDQIEEEVSGGVKAPVASEETTLGADKVDLNESIAAGYDEDEEESAMLARMRSRQQKSKGKVGSMSFSSKSAASKRSKVSVRDLMDESEEGANIGRLSFADDAGEQKERKKMKIRPNLSVPNAAEDKSEEAKESTNLYSGDMLASLIKEQNVLRRSVPDSHAAEYNGDDVDMEPTVVLDDELQRGSPVGPDETEEEFIPLNSKLMQARKQKKRVTFGVQDDRVHLPKTTEIEEPMDEEDDEEDQSAKWEEELMRRGGRNVQSSQASERRRKDAKGAYPTRKKIPRASLSDVMMSLQRKLEHASVENDRVARELSRLDAEASLIEQKLKEQREEHLVSSEQFEYFQEVEDFVKGLSYCLREKVLVIEAKEKEIAAKLVENAKSSRELRKQDILDEVHFCLSSGVLSHVNVVGTPVDTNGHSESSAQDMNARLVRFQQVTAASKTIQHDLDVDIFADAVDDMNSIDRVYGRFQEWKAKFPDVYKTSYCDLALVKLYGPYVRAELLSWDPLASFAGSGKKQPHILDDMVWFRTLRQHITTKTAELEEPVLSLVRDVVIAQVSQAIDTRFDPFSAAHVSSLTQFLEGMQGTWKQSEHTLDALIQTTTTHIVATAKSLPLLALDDNEVKVERSRIFASYLISQFCNLLENALTLFVTLPRDGAAHLRGFQCVMQLLHQLLAYLNQSKQLGKTALAQQATQTVQQLSGSSFMQSLVARSAREQQEFRHLLELFQPHIST
ncbi:hypothetical protein Poli38472_000756 [Pythium oligandrum]|uniref:GCF C-terminal domain-containing protein n=1 Tax=Pythium oligandrum TaxID=41045 RepID=A0A8K1CC81_PYTOL|nr:hypothetical protein Poli38472_000756 [Pythium oligandrum]|eukprot:TMW60714.1 hypothetical protein Poli38472_000756 [Pythium oligandrum]